LRRPATCPKKAGYSREAASRRMWKSAKRSKRFWPDTTRWLKRPSHGFNRSAETHFHGLKSVLIGKSAFALANRPRPASLPRAEALLRWLQSHTFRHRPFGATRFRGRYVLSCCRRIATLLAIVALAGVTRLFGKPHTRSTMCATHPAHTSGLPDPRAAPERWRRT
jgi:hypothetical protein